MKLVFISWLINRLSHDSLRPNEPVGETKTKWNLHCCCFQGGNQTNDDPLVSFRKNIKNGESRIKRKFRCVRWLVNRCSSAPSKPTGYDYNSETDSNFSIERHGLKSEAKPRERENVVEAGSSFWDDWERRENGVADNGSRTEASVYTGSVLPTDNYDVQILSPVHLGTTTTGDYSRSFSFPAPSAGLQKDSSEFFHFDSNFAFPNHDFLNFVEQDWENGTGVGPSNMITSTLESSQNESNMVLESDQYNTNYNVVEQNNNKMVRQVSQDELHIANKFIDTGNHETRPDTIHNSPNTTPIDQVDNKKTSKISISLEVLERHFKMSMGEAAKSLDVSLSTLKRICRRNGIKRWPNRCKRKNIYHEQSPDPKNVQELVKTNDKDQINQSTTSRALVVSPLGEASTSSKNVMIKAMYGDDIVKFPISISCGLNELKEEMCLRLGIKIPIKLKRMDDDGDLVLIACDIALQEFFGCRNSSLLERNTRFDFSVFRDTNDNV